VTLQKNMATLEAIKYEHGKLEILDQLLLPKVTQYINIDGTEDGWHAIRRMQVCVFRLPDVCN